MRPTKGGCLMELSLLSFFERKEYASLLIILRHINDPLVQEVPE